MFIIECLTKYFAYPNIITCCEFDSLFCIICILNDAKDITQFKVSRGVNSIYMPKDLGWNGFDKWVSKFTYD